MGLYCGGLMGAVLRVASAACGLQLCSPLLSLLFQLVPLLRKKRTSLVISAVEIGCRLTCYCCCGGRACVRPIGPVPTLLGVTGASCLRHLAESYGVPSVSPLWQFGIYG